MEITELDLEIEDIEWYGIDETVGFKKSILFSTGVHRLG